MTPALPRLRAALPWLVIAGVGATIAVGLAITAAHPGVGFLGTPLPPFLMSWSPAFGRPGWIAVAVVVAVLMVVLAPVVVERVRSGFAFSALIYLGCLVLGLAVNLARRGPSGWSHVFALNGSGSFEASREYLPALGDLHGGVAHYVRDFPQLLPGLPTHVKGNPPGPVVVMHLLGITTADRLTWACVVVGALVAPAAYALGRTLGGVDASLVGSSVDAERRGRVAAALCAFSPSVVLFGVTSVDFAFAGIGALAAWLLVSRPRAAWLTGCVLAAIGSFLSYLLLAIPVWAVLVVWRRDGLRPAIGRALVALAAILALTGLLALVWGYDPIAILRVVRRIYAAGAAAHRPYAFWLFGSPSAFLAMLGLPIAWLSVRALARGEAAALALALVIVLSVVTGTTKAETERIWLPYVPLACVAAAAVPVRRLRLILVVLAAQAVVVELLFGTTW